MRTLVIVAVAAMLARAAPARAEAGNVPAARTAFEQGRLKYELGDFAEAARWFGESYRLSRAPLLLYNLGQAHRLGGQCLPAARAYQTFLRLHEENRSQTDQQEAAAARGHLAALAACATAAPAPGRQARPPDLQARPGRRLGAAAAASVVGIAALVGALYFGHQARALGKSSAGAASFDPAADARGRRAERWQWGLYGAGGLAIATGGYLFFTY